MKVNFDGSIMDGREEVGVVIRDPNFQLIMAEGVWLMEISMHGAKLRVALGEIYFARLTLRVDWLIIEDGFAMVVVEL